MRSMWEFVFVSQFLRVFQSKFGFVRFTAKVGSFGVVTIMIKSCSPAVIHLFGSDRFNTVSEMKKKFFLEVVSYPSQFKFCSRCFLALPMLRAMINVLSIIPYPSSFVGAKAALPNKNHNFSSQLRTDKSNYRSI